jgi:hypothetical protein
MGRVRRDDGSRADTGFFGITNAPHFVELDWVRSAGPGADNGVFRLRIDDVLVSTLGGIDNDNDPVEFAGGDDDQDGRRFGVDVLRPVRVAAATAPRTGAVAGGSRRPYWLFPAFVPPW